MADEKVFRATVKATQDTRGYIFRTGEKVKIVSCPENHPEAVKLVGKIGVIDLMQMPIDDFVLQLVHEPASIFCYISLDDGSKVAFDARSLEPAECAFNKIIKIEKPTDYWCQLDHDNQEICRVYQVRHGNNFPEDYIPLENGWNRFVVNYQKNKTIIDYKVHCVFLSFCDSNEWKKWKFYKFEQFTHPGDRVKTLGDIGVKADLQGVVEKSNGDAVFIIFFNKFELSKKP